MRDRILLCLLVAGASLAAVGSAGAQTIRHDIMDARAAREDIDRLREDRARARRHHDWRKVQQDDRLIAKDKKFLHNDVRKVIRAESHHGRW